MAITLPDFQTVFERAVKRKGSEDLLHALLPSPKNVQELQALSEDRYLAMMTKCINQAGFRWKVIENKWPEFEAAFFGFKIDTLLMLSDEQWEAYTQDRRVVRNWQKVKTVKDNAYFIYHERQERDGIGPLIANWPTSDQIGLMTYLKKHGARLGGNTAQWFLRNMGKDGFVLTKDVITALISGGLEIKLQPASQKDFNLIQQTFNQWHDESKLPYMQLSKIAAYSVGDNRIGIEP